MNMKSICKGCGRPIIWAYTEAGKRMPLDPEPVPDALVGTFVITGNQCRSSSPMFDSPDTVHHMAHWSSCPVADSFRGKKP